MRIGKKIKTIVAPQRKIQKANEPKQKPDFTYIPGPRIPKKVEYTPTA